MLGRRLGRGGLVRMAAQTAVIAGTATAVSGGIQRRQANSANDQAQQQQYAAQQQQDAMNQAAAAAVAAQMAAQPVAPAPVAAPVAAPAAPATDLVGELTKLGTLHTQGVLTDAEFESAKAQLLHG